MSIAELTEIEAAPEVVEAPPDPIGDPDSLYEIIDGRVVEKAVGYKEIQLGFDLGLLLADYGKRSGVGRPSVENMYRTRANPSRKRRPDVAFLTFDRWPADREYPQGDALEVAPDLAVEVVSPRELAEGLFEKIQEYFRANVRQVWIVSPRTATIAVHESPRLARTYHRGDVLDGGDFLAGFRLAVSDLLAEPVGPPPPDDD